jgi:hypothetical protein
MCINYTVVFNTWEGAQVLVSMNGRLLQKTGKIICMHDNSTGSLSSVKTWMNCYNLSIICVFIVKLITYNGLIAYKTTPTKSLSSYHRFQMLWDCEILLNCHHFIRLRFHCRGTIEIVLCVENNNLIKHMTWQFYWLPIICENMRQKTKESQKSNKNK